MVPFRGLCKGFQCYIFSRFPQSSTTAMHSHLCKLREITACARTIALWWLRKGLQRSELVLRIRARIDFRMHLRDPACVLVFRRLGRTVRQSDLVVGVAQQRKIELLFLREFSVRFDAVEAGA